MVLPIVVPPATVPPALDLPALPASVHSEERAGRTHTVRSGETLYDIAERYGTSVGALRRHNQLDAGFIYPGQHLRIPSGGASSPAAKPARSAATRGYTVRSGDTLYGIAARHGMSVGRLASLNGVSSGSFIHPGQTLRVHGTAARPAKRPAARTSGSRHTVAAGQTLSGIASQHGMSVTRLAKINGLSARSFIYPGQRLRVAGTSRPAATTDGGAGFDHNTFAGRTYPSEIVSAASRNRQTLAGRPVPSRSQVRAKIVATAQRYGVDPSLALAISYQESGWDQRQVSVANAVGVMQVIPSSGDWTSGLVGRRLDLLDTDDNITAGVVLLQQLTRMASSDSQAIAGYYQGLGSVQKHGMYADTRGYVKNVQALRATM